MPRERWIRRNIFGNAAPFPTLLPLGLTGGGGLHGRVPFTLPFPSAVARADALQQVPPIVLLAPGVPDSVGRPSVLVVASVCDRKEAFKCM